MALNQGTISVHKMLSTVSRLAKACLSRKYLLYTNVVISTSLSGVGDIIEQQVEIFNEDQTHWEPRRTLNMSGSGVTIGIVCHYWYKYLDSKMPGYTIRLVTKKVIVDQFVGSPLAIATFFGTLGILEGSSYENFVLEVKQKAWRLYAAEWIIWPPAQFINFYFLPTKYRVIYDNTISLGYDVYTSYVKNNIPVEKPNKDN